MNHETRATRRGGRPRNPDRAASDAATIALRDAHARRLAREINAFLDAHVDAEAVRLSWAAIRLEILAACEALAVRVVEAGIIPAEADGRFRELLADTLRPLGPGRPEYAKLTGPELRARIAAIPPERRAVARRSRTLLQSRAQHANLRARLLDLQARVIAADEDPEPRW